VYFIRLTVNGTNTANAYLSPINSFDEFVGIAPYMHNGFAATETQFLTLSKSAEFSITGLINKDYGTLVTNASYKATDFIPLNRIMYPLAVHSEVTNVLAKYALYDSDKNFIRAVPGTNASLTVEDFVIYPEDIIGAEYIRLCSCIDNGTTPSIKVYDVLHSQLGMGSVGVQNVIFKEPDPATNLIDPDALIANRYVSGEDGTLKTANGFYATNYLPMKGGTQYYFNSSYLYRGYCAFYDTDKTFISGVDSVSQSTYLNSPFTAPAGTAYGRFTIAAQANIPNAWLCEYNRMGTKPPTGADRLVMTTAPENPASYTRNEIAVFNKILCIGDSLTEGFFNESGGSRLVMKNRSFPAKLQTLTGIECTNLGESGLTSAQWYTAHSSDDLSGHDACIIQLGVNDQLQSVSESDMDSALTSIINKVESDNTGIKIFVATIIPANGYMTTAMRTRSQMIRDFVAGLNDNNVYLLDMWTYGHTDDLLAYDAGHLSALGYLRLAEDYKSYISYVIHNNPDDFRYVQFIGTEYEYDGETYVRTITY
jgi:lysophospholipase L1-like esterase